MDFISADIETCGLKVENNDPLELSMIYCHDKIPIKDCPSLTIKFSPANGEYYKASPEALVMNAGLIKEISEMEEANLVTLKNKGDDLHWKYGKINPYKINGIIRDWYLANELPENEKLLFAGKNFAGFDRNWFEKFEWDDVSAQGKWKIHHRVLDPAMLYMRPHDKVPPSLPTCIERAGLPKSDLLHTAYYDAFIVAVLIRNHFDGRSNNICPDLQA